MPVDVEQLKHLLEAATKAPWKQVYAYNNGGMPTADFYIPGHNGNGTVELLADDAALIVAMRDALPDLIKVFEAADEFRRTHVDDPQSLTDDERQHQLDVWEIAKNKLMDAIVFSLPLEKDDEQEA